jgi:hypothetical protein
MTAAQSPPEAKAWASAWVIFGSSWPLGRRSVNAYFLDHFLHDWWRRAESVRRALPFTIKALRRSSLPIRP